MMVETMINTAGGPVAISALGKTLMHEHLLIAFPGWDSDTSAPQPTRAQLADVCAARIAELQGAGFSSLLDPCPNDMGRDVELMAQVARRTGFNIIFATGLYHGHLGGRAYWELKFRFQADAARELADLFVKELTEGVGDTGIKAGVIKVATADTFDDYEKTIFRAAAMASLQTGAPITTHTDAVLGEVQLAFLTELGVPAHRIIIGHSCGTTDHAYHRRLVEGGAYIGFDRFGLTSIARDEDRVAGLVKVIEAGFRDQVVISHDCPFCLAGHWPKGLMEAVAVKDGPLHFTRVITPMLHAAGVSQADIDAMLTENPRRYFAGEVLPI